jgi:delta-1-pyrroline-5-carboxylate synthetase
LFVQIIIHDNDALAAHLAAEVSADLLILMSDVDGVYNRPPGAEDSKLISVFTPNTSDQSANTIEFGAKSSVGLGGMESKVSSAVWALQRGTSVVICNGNTNNAISSIVDGKKIGTFFTLQNQQTVNVEQMAENGTFVNPDCRSSHLQPKSS